MEALIFGHAPLGMNGELIAVEVDFRRGIPGVDIVGLPDDAVRESRERVRAAIRNSGYRFPPDRVLMNLSPAGLRKVGASYDLALAVAILVASKQVPAPPEPLLACGELTLGGAVQPVTGTMAAVAAARRRGVGLFLLPAANHNEASALSAGRVVGVSSLADAAAALGASAVPARASTATLAVATAPVPRLLPPVADGDIATAAAGQAAADVSPWRRELGDLAEMRGHPVLKRALLVAAAGGHHLLLFGPPGTGKTMAARRLVGLLPRLSYTDSLACTQVHSLAGQLDNAAGLVAWPPFREPHHSASAEGVLGGGKALRPGEVSLAHAGVLLLDEAPEFQRAVLQGLREPLEAGTVQVVRAAQAVRYPAEFQLVLTANPCPCGALGRATAACACSVAEIKQHWKRLGGALLDRVDMRLPLEPVPPAVLLGGSATAQDDDAAEFVAIVARAVATQRDRYADVRWSRNGRLPAGAVARYCQLDSGCREEIAATAGLVQLSSRAIHSIARLARTVADIDGATPIAAAHVAEAIQYRRYGDNNLYWPFD